MKATSIAAGIGLMMAAATPAWADDDHSFGVWSNPSGSVHVRAEPCGERMCGVVIWANEKAQADAARGGTAQLVGTTLFQDFTPEKPGLWRGKVFVPDIRKTFHGTIGVLDETHLEGKGCLVGRIGCKSQTWTRIAH